MSSEAITKTYQAAGVIPAAPWRLRALSVLPQWQLAVTFNDGLTGIVDVSVLVHGPDAGVFEALRDPAFLRKPTLIAGQSRGPMGLIWRLMRCTRKFVAAECIVFWIDAAYRRWLLACLCGWW